MKEIISYEDFAKLDLRVGTIIHVENIEGADKLYKLTIDLGNSGKVQDEKRTLVAGIKKYYSKEELKGKQIIVIANLEPRKLKGIESKGMLLAAVDMEKDKVVLLTTEKKIESGSGVS